MSVGLRRKVKRYRRELLLALICLGYVLLKLIIFSNGFTFYDEGVYVSMGKYFASFGEKGYLETLRPLALPLALGPSQMLQLNGFITGRIMGILLTLACIVLVYHSANMLFGKKTGLWSAAFFAGSSLVVHYGGYILTDVICYTLLLFATALLIQKHHFVAGLAAGAAFLFKFPGLLGVLPLTLFILFAQKEKLKGSLLFSLGAFLGVLPYFLFNLFMYPGTLLEKLFGPMLFASGLINNTIWFVAKTSIVRYVTLLFTHEWVLIILAMLGLYYCFRKKKSAGILILGFVLVFADYFFFNITRYDERYMLSIIPFLAVLAGFGVAEFLTKKRATAASWLFIMAAIIPSVCMTLYLTTHIDFKTDPALEDALLGQREGITVTNTGFGLFYPHTKTELYPGPNIGDTYMKYRLNENASSLVISVDEIPCQDEACVKGRERKINKMVSSNSVAGCGMLHGHTAVMLTKKDTDENKDSMTREECLTLLNYSQESVQTETFFRLNTSLSELEDERNTPQLVLLLSLLKDDHVKVYVILKPENYALAHKQRVVELLTGTVLGVTDSDERDINEFIASVEMDLEQEVAVYVPSGDEWKGKMTMPKETQECMVGSWELSFPEKSCKMIDLYPLEELWTSQPIGPNELIAQHDALAESDDEVGVSFNLFSPTSHEYSLMLALAKHIDDGRRKEIMEE